MPVRKFSIVLDNPSGYYCAGARITGRILVWLDKARHIKGIKIKFSGKAHVSWHNRESRNQLNEKKLRTQFYSGNERYVNYDFFLIGNSDGKIKIPGGYEHSYPFYIDIPSRIPSSFQGEHGYIRYSITARLVKNWIFDAKEKIPVQIFCPKDLNCYPSAAVPICRKEEKTFFTPFHSSQGPLILDVGLPQSGFLPDQDIPVKIHITNGTSIAVDSVEVKIMKLTYWKVHLPRSDSKTTKTQIAKKNLNAIGVNETKAFSEIFNCGHFFIPNLDACSIINESFYVKVKLDVHSVYRKGLKIKIPIIFGTIPICNQQNQNLMYRPEFGSNYSLNSQQWNPALNLHIDPVPQPYMLRQSPTHAQEYRSNDPPPYSVAISMPPVSPMYSSNPPPPQPQNWTADYQQDFARNALNHESFATEKSVLDIDKTRGVLPTAPPQDGK